MYPNEVIYEEAGKMMIMTTMAIKKKGLMRPSQLLSVMQFVASDSLWEEEVVLLRRISCAFTKFVGFSKLEWCVHFQLHSYQGCIMISMIFDISQLQNLKKKNMVWGIHRVQLHFCVLGQICQNKLLVMLLPHPKIKGFKFWHCECPWNLKSGLKVQNGKLSRQNSINVVKAFPDQMQNCEGKENCGK